MLSWGLRACCRAQNGPAAAQTYALAEAMIGRIIGVVPLADRARVEPSQMGFSYGLG